MRNETCSRIHEIKVPVLILVGEGDVITPPDAAMKMHEKITSSDLVILPLAGHVSNLENPTEFNHQINVFLSKVLIKSS
jgi:pimeloyl-ACP methyl ester carboxylesterase